MVSSKSNNNNQRQEEEQPTNKFQHFLPGFAKRREIYNKAPPLRTGRKFPYIKEPLEYAYNNFITSVTNPSDSTYYPKTDENNYPIQMPGNINCKRIVLRIVRHRLTDGSEKLTSFSQIIGHDVYGNKKIFPCDSPERIIKPIFSIVKEYNTQKKQIVAYSEGPIGQEEVYEMPFTPEGVDSLYKLSYDGNPYFKPSSRGNQKIELLIKDHQNGGLVKEVFWSSVEDSLKVFKEKDFDHLWNSLYLPQAIREQMLMEKMGVVDSDKSNNNNGSTRAGPTTTSNNTSAYK